MPEAHASPHSSVPLWFNFPSRRGFTLVELLIVVAIIALLIGVLLPSLARSRAAAQQSVCASNIRQLVLANALYAHDADDHAVPGARRIQTYNLERWHGTRATPSAPFTPKKAPLLPYLDESEFVSAALRACPTFAPKLSALAQNAAGFERSCGGYAYNNAFVGAERYQVTPGVWEIRTDLAGSRRSRFQAPAATVEFADAAFAAEDLIEYSFVEPAFWPQHPGARPDPSIHFRHAARATVAWLDAHVTTEPMSRSGSSGLYTADPRDHAIGWFGPDDNSLFDYE